MRSKQDIQIAVKRGVVWLHLYKPGWRAKINLEKLKMSSAHWCVAAQAFDGDYAEARRLVRAQRLEPSDLGFTVGLGTCCAESGDEFEELTEAWKQALLLTTA